MRNFIAVGLSGLLVLGVVSCSGGSSTPPPTLTVSPSSASVALGTTQQFTAMSNSLATSATWSVNGVQGGNSTVGTIDNNGLYQAPAAFPSPNTFTVTATSSSATGTANLTVAYPNNNHTAETIPVQLGTTGGNATDFVDSGGKRTCCSGTLGAIVNKAGTLFILSNNHVLDKSDTGLPGQNIQQPGLVDNQCDVASAPPATSVGTLSQAAPLKPSPCSGVCTGPAPSNVDAAIAQIVPGAVDTSGSILDLGAAGPTSIAAAPPSSTIVVTPAAAQGVAKSGRSTGLTCSTIQSIGVTISVDYDVACGGAKAFTSIFSNQITINGGSFSSSGDSGALVVTSDTSRPVGLLYAGNSTSTSANPISDVITALGPFTFVPLSGTPNPDHAVSCQPTASASSLKTTVGASAATLSSQERERVTAVKQKYASQLLANPAVSDVDISASADNPAEGAVVITLNEPATVPAQLDGVRTRVIYVNTIPKIKVDANSPAMAIKQAHDREFMAQSGIQGVGLGVSDDNPAEAALVIYVITGMPHPEIPAVIDGLRTKIVEGDRFRAFGWGKETMPSACAKKQQSKPWPKSP